jgi:hypothetical protein
MGAWTEIVDFTFTADETSRAFTGLNITKDDFIKVVVTQVNGASDAANVALFPNSNTTSSNFTRQILNGSGSNVTAFRSNDNRIARADLNKAGYSVAYVKISENNKFNYFSLLTDDIGSSIVNLFEYCTEVTGTTTTLTSLTFTASETDGLGDGSRIQIYRLDAEKEADITTTANATQVDISSLSIGKDSEYLLVGDWTRNSTDQPLLLGVNNNVTIEDYYNQRIAGSDSTASALRAITPRISTGLSSDRSVFYAHIKLSEIGAFTVQSYSINRLGTSNVILENCFSSSTAENITSITALNLFMDTASNLASGARFQLYKLK